MSKIDLGKYGIKDVKEIVYNPSYELLFEEEMNTLPSIIKDNEVALESFKEKLKEYQQGLADDALEAYYLKEVEGVFEP